MNREILDLYTDYLKSSFGQTTATGLSQLGLLKVQTNKNHYQLKAQLYFSALQIAFKELQKLKSELSQQPATA